MNLNTSILKRLTASELACPSGQPFGSLSPVKLYLYKDNQTPASDVAPAYHRPETLCFASRRFHYSPARNRHFGDCFYNSGSVLSRQTKKKRPSRFFFLFSCIAPISNPAQDMPRKADPRSQEVQPHHPEDWSVYSQSDPARYAISYSPLFSRRKETFVVTWNTPFTPMVREQQYCFAPHNWQI